MMKCILFVLSQCTFYVNALMGENVRVAEQGEFPFVVAIKTINRTNPRPETDILSTGIVITNLIILTTLNGVQNVNLRTIEVLHSDHDIRLSQRRRVRWLLTYNQWALENHLPTQPFIDMCVLRLTNAISAPSVPLSALRRDELYRLNVVTAGWGKNTQGEFPMIMQTVKLKILRKSRCRARIIEITENFTYLHKKYICTDAHPAAFIRQGDNGGPVLYRGELVAMNKGICPPSDDDFHPLRINLHLAVDDFRNYLNSVILNAEN